MNKLVLSDRQELFLEYVKKMHGDQKRKYTHEPYWEHPLAVANIAATYLKEDLIIEPALGHDLLEDNETLTILQLCTDIRAMGYTQNETHIIVSRIEDLTDVFTPKAYPNLNRTIRKKMEAIRLGGISFASQSIKYADLIHNTSSIVKHDPDFAVTYLKEKREILTHMRGGNVDLLIQCCHHLYQGIESLCKEDETYIDFISK